MVQITCADERLDAFNTWYNSHLPNLLRIPGITWAQRYINLEKNGLALLQKLYLRWLLWQELLFLELTMFLFGKVGIFLIAY